MNRKLAGIIVGVLLVAGCATTGSTGSTGEQKATEGSADFTLNSVTGESVNLSGYLGKKVILLNFWGTWCIPCQAEMPHLQEMYEKYKDQGFVIFGIAMDGPDTVSGVAPFVRRNGLTYPILLDQESQVVGLYNPHRSAPFNVFIGLDGKVSSTREGYNLGDEKAIEETVQALLATVPASVQ
jgi:peroxiredoxin